MRCLVSKTMGAEVMTPNLSDERTVRVARVGGRRQKSRVGPLFTVGHSTRTLDELVRICAAHGVRAIADVRRFPGSRRSPHFARHALEQSLPEHGVAYLWLPALGGAGAGPRARRRRRGRSKPSPHTPST